jgi:hypothetical protein
MTIPITKKILLTINLSFWVIHLSILCLPYYRMMPKYGISEWCELVYNLSALIIVFYATAHFMQQWLNNFSLTVFKDLPPYKRAFYVFNTQIFKILLLTAAYIIVSLVLENEFFGRYNYTEIPLQFERRLVRINTYAMGGPFYALALFLIRKLNNYNRVLESENKDLHKSFYQIGDLYKTLKEETAKN